MTISLASSPRRVREDGWTLETQRAFIESLADSGCVRTACAAVGRSSTSAYAQRLRNDGFAEAWAAALDLSYHHLRSIALDRVRNGVEQRVYDADGKLVSRKVMPSDRLLMFLIRHTEPQPRAFTAPPGVEPPEGYFDTFEERYAKAVVALGE